MTPRHCTAPGCGKLLVRGGLSTAAWERRQFCNRECRAVGARASRVEASKVCQGKECGKVFHRRPGEHLYSFNIRQYCSRECYRPTRETRAQRKKGTKPGRVVFVAIGNANLNKAMTARRIARAPKGRFESVEEALSRGVIIDRIELSNPLPPAGMAVGSKTGWGTGKVGRWR